MPVFVESTTTKWPISTTMFPSFDTKTSFVLNEILLEFEDTSPFKNSTIASLPTNAGLFCKKEMGNMYA